eukprot:9478966-Alexandrium_andersonii.AAC.1
MLSLLLFSGRRRPCCRCRCCWLHSPCINIEPASQFTSQSVDQSVSVGSGTQASREDGQAPPELVWHMATPAWPWGPHRYYCQGELGLRCINESISDIQSHFQSVYVATAVAFLYMCGSGQVRLPGCQGTILLMHHRSASASGAARLHACARCHGCHGVAVRFSMSFCSAPQCLHSSNAYRPGNAAQS